MCGNYQLAETFSRKLYRLSVKSAESVSFFTEAYLKKFKTFVRTWEINLKKL
jgi:hypothetical protein